MNKRLLNRDELSDISALLLYINNVFFKSLLPKKYYINHSEGHEKHYLTITFNFDKFLALDRLCNPSPREILLNKVPYPFEVKKFDKLTIEWTYQKMRNQC